eukprot:3709761-Rhodomonas_salina.1
MSEAEGVGLENEANTNPFETSEFYQWQQSSPSHELVVNAVDDSMMGVNGSAIPTGLNAEESPVSSNTSKERRKLHWEKRNGQFNPSHPDADLQKYSNLQNGLKFLEACVVVVASPDKSKTALLKDRAKDCADKMSKDSIEEHILQSDKELFHCFQGLGQCVQCNTVCQLDCRQHCSSPLNWQQTFTRTQYWGDVRALVTGCCARQDIKRNSLLASDFYNGWQEL